LEGSIPAEGLLDLERYRVSLENRPRSADWDEHEWRRRNAKLAFARLDSWLDHHPAVRHLADTRLAQLVVDALYRFAGERYDLLAFVIMPSHIHWVFQPFPAWVETLEDTVPVRTPRQRIQHSVNRFTARECNVLLGTSGSFLQRESYDHWVRDVDELERIICYIEENPVRAGLVDSPANWPFSSAHDRLLMGTEYGVPLLRKREMRQT
jgi:type I restriction enzyme R subunit